MHLRHFLVIAVLLATGCRDDEASSWYGRERPTVAGP